MRILLHDYSGHPFQVQLARALAAGGHDVLHVYSASFQTPHGALDRREGDPSTFRVEAIDVGRFRKYELARRFFQERDYGRRLASLIRERRPDVVLSSNTPLDAQEIARCACADLGIGFVFWLQDIYSAAIRRTLSRRVPVLGDWIGARYVRLERRLLAESHHVVAIADAFARVLDEWGVPPERVSVVPNWAPLEDLSPRPRDNPWAREHGLTGRFVFLYAGTLGLKHDPGVLLELARRHSATDAVRVVVISEGIGADWLRARATGLRSLVQLPFQPFERLPEVVASADVLLAILDRDAGAFSVPSKVLTYMCARRPLLAAIPGENLAARLIRESDGGIVVPPGDARAFLDGAQRLHADPGFRAACADNGRTYAERTFDIGPIASRFEEILRRAATLGKICPVPLRRAV